MIKLVERITLLTFSFLLVNISSGQDILELNDSKEKILKNIIWNFHNNPNYFPLINSKYSVNQKIEMNTKIIERGSYKFRIDDMHKYNNLGHWFEAPGTINGKPYIYEIGISNDGLIFHRNAI